MIMFDDCKFDMTMHGDIRLKLPIILDLEKVPYTQTHQGGHYLWENSKGTLLIPCDMSARFSGEESLIQKLDFFLVYPVLPNTFKFQSEYAPSNWRFNSFVYYSLGENILAKLNLSDPKTVIQDFPLMLEYTDQFLNWINKFAEEHPEGLI